MRRPIPLLLFPILAAIAGLSWLARLVAGLVPLTDSQARFDLIAMLATYAAHGMTQQYLQSSWTKIRAKVGAEGLPNWVGAQSEKNFRKVVPYVSLGCLLNFIPVALSWTKAFEGRLSGAWFDGLLAFNLAFQVGAFVGEYVIMAAQDRLLRNVEGWAAQNSG